MLAPPKPPAHDELEALIKEARARQLRRRLLAAAGVAIAAALGLGAYAIVTSGKTHGIAPATAGQAHAPLCGSNQLLASVGFQGATQSMVGGVILANESSAACSLPHDRALVSLSWRGKELPTGRAT